jgi:hypothetical protein
MKGREFTFVLMAAAKWAARRAMLWCLLCLPTAALAEVRFGLAFPGGFVDLVAENTGGERTCEVTWTFSHGGPAQRFEENGSAIVSVPANSAGRVWAAPRGGGYVNPRQQTIDWSCKN